jgi:hypothetical protein
MEAPPSHFPHPLNLKMEKKKEKKVDKWLIKTFPPNFPSLFNSPPYIRKTTPPPPPKTFKHQICIKTNKLKKNQTCQNKLALI